MPVITKMTDVRPQDEYLRALIYGSAGAGKTEFLGSLPKPLWIADFDGKLKPLIGIPGIDVTSYTTDNILGSPEIFIRFKKDWREVSRDPKYASMALDSLTSFDTVSLKYFCSLSKAGIEATASLPVYGDQSNYYNFFFSEMKGAKKNVFITAHESYITEETDAGQIIIRAILPLITGKKILEKLPSQFEELWYLERSSKDDKRILHWRPYKKAIASSTFLKGTGEIALPSLQDSVSAWDTLMLQKGKEAINPAVK